MVIIPSRETPLQLRAMAHGRQLGIIILNLALLHCELKCGMADTITEIENSLTEKEERESKYRQSHTPAETLDRDIRWRCGEATSEIRDTWRLVWTSKH